MVAGNLVQELDTVVIGSGPGGYVAAIRAAQLGQSVTIIEREAIGGVCLNVGCIPSKALITIGHRYQEVLNSQVFGITATGVALDFAQAQTWKNEKVVAQLTKGVESLLKANKVQILRGEAYFTGPEHLRVIEEKEANTYHFKHAIIATGSRPVELEGFGFGQRILDSTAALALTEVPKRLVVIGGGYIGSELAGAFANLGSEVTILEGLPSILAQFDEDMVKLVTRSFKKKGVKVVTNARALGAVALGAVATDDEVQVTYEAKGKTTTIRADYVLVTVGRRPNTDDLGLDHAGVKRSAKGLIEVDQQGRTNVPSIFAIGDVVPGLALAHKASYEAKIAAAAISGDASAVIDYRAIPAVAFTDPELATVGLTAAEAGGGADGGVGAGGADAGAGASAGADGGVGAGGADAGAAAGAGSQAFEVKTAKFPFAANGRALSMDEGNGFVRLISEVGSGRLLGAQVAGHGASELIAELTLAIEAGVSTEDLSLTIHAHPTLSEMVMDAAELAEGLPIHVLG